jgi:hypothetical protein
MDWRFLMAMPKAKPMDFLMVKRFPMDWHLVTHLGIQKVMLTRKDLPMAIQMATPKD